MPVLDGWPSPRPPRGDRVTEPGVQADSSAAQASDLGLMVNSLNPVGCWGESGEIRHRQRSLPPHPPSRRRLGTAGGDPPAQADSSAVSDWLESGRVSFFRVMRGRRAGQGRVTFDRTRSGCLRRAVPGVGTSVGARRDSRRRCRAPRRARPHGHSCTTHVQPLGCSSSAAAGPSPDRRSGRSRCGSSLLRRARATSSW